MSETEVRYLPALSGVRYSLTDKWKNYKGGNDIAWWTKDSIYYYPHVLLSFGVGERDEKKYWQNAHKINDDVFVMGDSGGFQKASRDLDFEPNEVLDWQLGDFGENNMREMSAGIILDDPPHAGHEDLDLTDEQFKKKALSTKANIEEVEKRLNNSDMLSYGVIHGDSHSRINKWWKIAVEPFDFENIAWAPRSSNLTFLASIICYLDSKNVKKLHLLAYTGLRKQVLINYCKKLNFDLITYDSSTFGVLPQKGALLSRYYTKIPVGNRARSSSLNEKKIVDLCDCPFCSIASKYNEYYTKLDSTKHYFIKAHNFYQTLKMQEFLYWLCDDREACSDFLSQMSIKDLNKSLDFIDDYLEKGFENAYNTHIKGLNKNQGTLGGSF